MISSPALTSIGETFVASVRSVGTAVTLAAVGMYLHRRGFVSPEGKKTLALISQQVTFPLFLFTKIIFCNQDWSSDPCPDVTRSLRDVWMLLFWPAYVVGCGVLVGKWTAKLTKTPKHQVKAVLAACAFGNSTGLPITLLTVVHSNFPSTSDLGHIDPTLFLSVYLLLYPVLQWGYGGWLLAPDEDEAVQEEESENHLEDQDSHVRKSPARTDRGEIEQSPYRSRKSITDNFRHNVLNHTEINSYYHQHRRGLSSADEGNYMSEIDLLRLAETVEASNAATSADMDSAEQGTTADKDSSLDPDEDHAPVHPEVHPLLKNNESIHSTSSAASYLTHPPPPSPPPLPLLQKGPSNKDILKSIRKDEPTFWETVHNITSRCLQPPVIGAITGILVAITPLRGIFVDLVDRSSHAPLQWIFDGLYNVGHAAVPINMMILGCNLSVSFQTIFRRYKGGSMTINDVDKGTTRSALFPYRTMVGVVLGKMVILPIVGILSCYILKSYVLDIPDEIDGAFYLVMMIVFLTPTANNVMVMVELSGSGAKEGIASVIALQYALAPIILSVTMSIAVGFASNWS